MFRELKKKYKFTEYGNGSCKERQEENCSGYKISLSIVLPYIGEQGYIFPNYTVS